MPAPQSVIDLVKRFESQRADYRAGRYNETQLRRDFLDPFFEALGWDVANQQGYAERYREVIHEVSVEVEGKAKAADYAFQAGGKTIFFVEAKKPAVNIATNPEPAFQLRRYGWSAKLRLSLLTDFEQLAVYDCANKPSREDKVTFGRWELYDFPEYITQWDEIAGRFSRQAVLQGDFERYAGQVAGKKGAADVDDAFLGEIERWRELLARNLALRNPALNDRQLNFAVQMTIDRIVFLRICEERAIEPEEQLRKLAAGKDVYAGLTQLFRQADQRYNSGLFHFANEKSQPSQPDDLTLGLELDDKPLKDIIRNLYYPDSPYAFNYIPADILGQVYERFLGKVIRLTEGHHAKVEEKPEVRKAGGVYYTPTYIVDYIVQNTLGKLLEGQTPAEAARLKLVDPACGSGTFLLQAYQYLLDWHLEWYSGHEPAKWARGKEAALFQSPEGWRLTSAKKKEILLNTIHGVDIDAQAVEVTKLSLLLKVLEGESAATVGGQMRLLQERVLPDLGRNIQCGNSLIGPDYYAARQMSFDLEEQYRVNAFDWKAAFPQVFSPSPGSSRSLTPNPSPSGGGEHLPLPQGEGRGEEKLESLPAKPPLPPHVLARCRELRQNATQAEQLLWELLRDRQLGEAKFRRQHPLGGYILDFYCHEARLCIELDGGGHLEEKQARYDEQRTRQLEALGVQVLRFWNRAVLQETEAVLQAIWEALPARLAGPASGGTGEARGEGGFDVVIGNPPYIRIQTMQEWIPASVEYFKRAYRAASKGNYDIYVVFVEKGLSLLNRQGRLGFILPHKFFNAQYGQPLRAVLAKGQNLSKVVHFGDQQVFDGATTYTCLLFLDKAGQESFEFEKVESLPAWRADRRATTGAIPAASVTAAEWNFTVGKGAGLFEKLSQIPVKLGNVAKRIYQGPITSADSVYLFKEFHLGTSTVEVYSKELEQWVQIEFPILKRVVRSGNVGRYWAIPSAFVLFPYSVQNNTATLLSQTELQNHYPLAWDYLSRNRKLLESRENNSFKDAQWYRFGRTQNLGMWEQPKLLIPYMITDLSAHFDIDDKLYFINVTTGGYGITIDQDHFRYEYVGGLLNSRLLNFYLKHVSTTFHGGYFAANKQYIEQLPIRTIDPASPADVQRHDRLVALVEQMLALHQQLAAAKMPQEKELLQRQVSATDRAIDTLVYELYGLTDEEIRIVEGEA